MSDSVNKIKLRDKIEQTKADYTKRYGKLDWKWTDEGLPWAIQDYHGSVGSVMDFTEDDWLACKENGWTLDEVCDLCGEEERRSDVDTLTEYLAHFPAELEKDATINAENDFYKWREELLPIITRLYEGK